MFKIGSKGTRAFAASLAMLPASMAVSGEMISVTDLAGRTVEVKHGVQRVILGQGRMLDSVAILEGDNPLAHIVGWRTDLKKFDPGTYSKYQQKFGAALDGLESFGKAYKSDFSVENAISLQADLLIMNLGNLTKAKESGIIEKMQTAGIPVIFVDYQVDALKNTTTSMELLGKVFAKEERAAEFIAYYSEQLERVTSVTASYAEADKPLVFMDKLAGFRGPEFCCMTYSDASFGRFAAVAGGNNWGTQLFSGAASDVHLEALLAVNPDVVVGTTTGWFGTKKPGAIAVPLGYDTDPADMQQRLQGLTHRTGWQTMKAVKNKRFYTIYHQFYDTPFNFVAVQQLAKWFHPDDFADLDPTATFKEVHSRFLPIDYSGIFWGQLQQTNNAGGGTGLPHLTTHIAAYRH